MISLMRLKNSVDVLCAKAIKSNIVAYSWKQKCGFVRELIFYNYSQFKSKQYYNIKDGVIIRSVHPSFIRNGLRNVIFKVNQDVSYPVTLDTICKKFNVVREYPDEESESFHGYVVSGISNVIFVEDMYLDREFEIFVALHEISHLILGNFGNSMEEEKESDYWAIETARRTFGFSFSKRVMNLMNSA